MKLTIRDSCPLRLRLPASLVGTIIAILNSSLTFIIPAVVAVFIMYPWLFRKLQGLLIVDGKPRYFNIALYFAFYVSVLTAILLSFVHLSDGIERIAPESWSYYPLGFLYMVFFFGLAALMLIPATAAISYLYTLANYHFIKKYYHPNTIKSS